MSFGCVKRGLYSLFFCFFFANKLSNFRLLAILFGHGRRRECTHTHNSLVYTINLVCWNVSDDFIVRSFCKRGLLLARLLVWCCCWYCCCCCYRRCYTVALDALRLTLHGSINSFSCFLRVSWFVLFLRYLAISLDFSFWTFSAVVILQQQQHQTMWDENCIVDEGIMVALNMEWIMFHKYYGVHTFFAKVIQL